MEQRQVMPIPSPLEVQAWLRAKMHTIDIEEKHCEPCYWYKACHARVVADNKASAFCELDDDAARVKPELERRQTGDMWLTELHEALREERDPLGDGSSWGKLGEMRQLSFWEGV